MLLACSVDTQSSPGRVKHCQQEDKIILLNFIVFFEYCHYLHASDHVSVRFKYVCASENTVIILICVFIYEWFYYKLFFLFLTLSNKFRIMNTFFIQIIILKWRDTLHAGDLNRVLQCSQMDTNTMNH